MDLRRPSSFATGFFGALLLLGLLLPAGAQNRPGKVPELIRDTDAADGKADVPDAPAKKEPNPALAEQNLNIGNFYFKKKNYEAAIGRYLEAIEYQPDSFPAYDALTRAYEKTGDMEKAARAYREFIGKSPDSPRLSEFRARLAKIEKKQPLSE